LKLLPLDYFLKFGNIVRLLPRSFFLNTRVKVSWQSADWQLRVWDSYLLLKQVRKQALLKSCNGSLLKSSLGTNLCLDPKGIRMLCFLNKLLHTFMLLPSYGRHFQSICRKQIKWDPLEQ